MTPKIFIIIVNHNGFIDTIECIQSLLELEYSNFNIIVVDNSSTSRDIDELLKWAHEKKIGTNRVNECELSSYLKNDKKLTLIKSESNKGFAAANNLGLRSIEKDPVFGYAWLLNNDTTVDKSALSELVKCASISNKRIGMWGAKLMLYYSPTQIQGVGGRYNKWFGKIYEIGFGEKDNGQWDNVDFRFDYVLGASIFVKKEFIDEVGVMEEDYFLYYEELDWAIRGKKRKWELGFCPKSIVYHKMGSSINRNVSQGNSLLADYYSVRNRILISRKYFPVTQISLYPSFMKFVYNRIRLKQFSRLKILVKLMVNPRLHLNSNL